MYLATFLDNIRSIYNVGSIFRTADGAGVGHIYLGGYTATPEHPRLAKTALGAEESVAWSKHWDSLVALRALKAEGFHLWGLEGTSSSTPLFQAAPAGDQRHLLIVGNEIQGVQPEILALCDDVVHIPMRGVKESLNVAFAFGVAAYGLLARAQW